MRPVFFRGGGEIKRGNSEPRQRGWKRNAAEEIRGLKRRRVYYEFGAEVSPFYVTSTVGNVERIVAALGQ